MAEEVQIQGSDYVGKIRNPLAPALLPFITLGIYALVWYYKINKEMAKMGEARNTQELGTSPGTSLLAVTLGAFILVPPFLSFYNTWKRKVTAENMTGQDGMEAGLGFLLTILLSPVGYYILQRDLNNVIQAQAGGAPQAAIPGGQAAAPPPPPPPPPAQQPQEGGQQQGQ
jgi:Domain of unknown function (DUF4234)